ncbi:MAG TPA: hypothetical protein PLY48_04565 [Candidatus Cloacimonas acidaminovorans]|nr:hypothetical protein [Candidatus Cloacimonadota bacterium]OQC72272.1 MAG: hypothetical protein BWX46_00393 [Candidatus Cloacimonetes bacterium ADurb.Bin003]HNV63205.1 hypothetical protein [Candidatus Cloacimonas acidaminovorans]HPI42086.1 hypothetical protein [Candidatus Cloacimonas acidaminovorans]HPX58188.1 hypothetical protein [Candidatus Cloacimonas acidaminovorans]
MKSVYGLLLIGVILVFFSPALLSDTVKLTNGNVIYGHITREDIDKVTIVDQNGIENIIPRNLIIFIDKQLETTREVQKVIITLKSGIEVKGTLILDDANSVTIKDESGIEKKIAKSNIRDIVIDLDKPDERPITIKSYEEPETEIETETEAEIVTTPAEKTNNFDFGLKFGSQKPNSNAISDKYSNGIVYGGELIFWLKNKYGIGLNVEKFSEKSEYWFYNEGNYEYNISIIPITLTVYYKHYNNKIVPYIGLGIGQYNLTEKIKYPWYYYYKELEVSDEEYGFHCLFGLQYKILFVEVKYSTMFKSTWGAEEEYDDIGGLSIAGGLRF